MSTVWYSCYTGAKGEGEYSNLNSKNQTKRNEAVTHKVIAVKIQKFNPHLLPKSRKGSIHIKSSILQKRIWYGYFLFG